MRIEEFKTIIHQTQEKQKKDLVHHMETIKESFVNKVESKRQES